MTALLFDETKDRLIESGVDHGVLYPQTTEGTYPKGVAWNGLISVSENPGGADANDMYADNIKYASLRSAETFGATVEAYTYPDEFAVCDGTAEVAEGVRIGQQKRSPFGLSYRTKVQNAAGQEGYKLHLVYNATASPSEKQYQTINDSPDAITFSWEMETTPVAITGHQPTATIVIDSMKVDAEKLAILEKALYGDTDTEPHLPSPDEVVAMFA